MSNEEQNTGTNSLNEAEAKKRELVNFVANNILNSITLNQTITVIQQIALRDANTIVTDADEEKLKQIEESYAAAKAQAETQAEAAAEAQAATPAEEKPKKKKGKKDDSEAVPA